MLLSPPSVAAVNAFSVSDGPTVPPANVIGAISTPATAANANASDEANIRIRLTLMPSAPAAIGSAADATIALP